STTISSSWKRTRIGENFSLNRSTTSPVVERATFGRRATPRSSRPNMLAQMPFDAISPSLTRGWAAALRDFAAAFFFFDAARAVLPVVRFLAGVVLPLVLPAAKRQW